VDAAVEILEILLHASDGGVHVELPPVAGRTSVCGPGRRRVLRSDEMGDAAAGWEQRWGEAARIGGSAPSGASAERLRPMDLMSPIRASSKEPYVSYPWVDTKKLDFSACSSKSRGHGSHFARRTRLVRYA
jgi:hypothetical protein